MCVRGRARSGAKNFEVNISGKNIFELDYDYLILLALCRVNFPIPFYNP